MRAVPIIGVIAMCLLVPACTSSGETPGAPALVATTRSAPPSPMLTATFPDYGLSFDYPASWKPATFEMFSSFSHLITYLSNQGLSNPCSTVTAGVGMTVTCGPPLKALDAGGVLVRWELFGMPGKTLAREPGEARTIGGHPARVRSGPADGGCVELGGQTSLSAVIQAEALGSHDEMFEVTACMRDPGAGQAEVDLNRMLDSVQFAPR